MIISLSGKKGAGKDTAALFIQEYLQNKFDINMVSFAKKLKDTCAEAFNINEIYMFDAKEFVWSKPEKFTINIQKKVLKAYNLNEICAASRHIREFKNGREMLQYIGTEFLRGYDDQIHLKKLPLKADCVNIVTDTRFENEIDFLSWYAGNQDCEIKSFYIDRPSAETGDGHSSEQFKKEWCDIIIKNDGTLDDLKEQILKHL